MEAAQVVIGTSPESLLGTYHAERHPVAARVLANVMAQTELLRPGERIDALRDTLNLGVPGSLGIAGWADRVKLVDATYDGGWERPVLGPVAAPAAVLIRPDGHVAWMGDGTELGLHDALTSWFGGLAAAYRSLRC